MWGAQAASEGTGGAARPQNLEHRLPTGLQKATDGTCSHLILFWSLKQLTIIIEHVEKH